MKPTELHVAITGASSGIGEALAREWATAGAAVTLVARRTELLDKLVAELGPRTRAVSADLVQPEAATGWLRDAEAAFGPIDILVNNAGVQIVANFADTTLAEGERLMALNLLTPLRLMHAVLPGMIGRGRGAIVNIASVAALVPTPGMVHYCASKAGLGFASETLRSELRGTGVRVLTVYPGPVETAMMRAAVDTLSATSSMAKRMPAGTTEQLARRVRKGVECDTARIVYPRLYGATRWLAPVVAPLTAWLTPKPRKLT